MTWTTTKPEKPGWYWFRYSMDHTPIIVTVSAFECGCLYRESSTPISRGSKSERWSGPIPEPEEGQP